MNMRLIDAGRPAEILLIDDNRGDATLYGVAFRDVSSHTDGIATSLTAVQTGEAALAVLRGEDEYAGRRLPDMILLDLGLPQMSGLDVLTAIKTADDWKHIPVIVMSNSGAGDNILASYRQYASAYILKPSDIRTFRETIASVVKFYFQLATLASEN